MNQYGTLCIKQRQRLLDAAACLDQSVALIADTDVDTEMIIRFELVDNLIGEMVDIDHHPLIARRPELRDDVPE